MSEKAKRDSAMRRAANNPNNNYDLILGAARYWLLKQRIGALVVSGQIFKAVLDAHPDSEPQERRVLAGDAGAAAGKDHCPEPAFRPVTARIVASTTEWRRLAS